MKHKLMLGYNQIVNKIKELADQGKSEKEILDILMAQYEIPKRINLSNLIYEVLNDELKDEEE